MRELIFLHVLTGIEWKSFWFDPIEESMEFVFSLKKKTENFVDTIVMSTLKGKGK